MAASREDDDCGAGDGFVDASRKVDCGRRVIKTSVTSLKTVIADALVYMTRCKVVN